MFNALVDLHVKPSSKIDFGIINVGTTIIALDLSTKTGFAAIIRTNSGLQFKAKRIECPPLENVRYPRNYLDRADMIANSIVACVGSIQGNKLFVIEETNGSKSRYAQKMLEFIHCAVIRALGSTARIVYINSSDWRAVLGLQLTKEQKRQNQLLRKKLREGKSKKEIGIRGKITKKHLALNFVSAIFEESFKVKDNDVAEALCIGIAYTKDIEKYGYEYCNGT